MATLESLVRQGLRFVVGGALNTGVTFLLYWLLLLFLNYQVAYALSFIAGIGLSYALNTRFVFRAKHTWTKLALFPLMYFCTYLVGAFVLKLAVAYFNVPAQWAPIVSVCVTLPLSFVMSRLILFDRGSSKLA